MNKNIVICVFLASALLPASAGADKQIKLSEYKTIAVQPMLAASNTRGVFESHLAAQATLLSISPAASKKFAGISLGGDDSGFGFAGKAKQSDIQILGAAASFGMLPALMKIQPEAVAESIVKLRAMLPIFEGKVSPDVVKLLDVALTAAANNDAQNTSRSLLMACGAAADAIGKGSERAHGYMATGLYSGFATLWALGETGNPAYADLAAPLVMLLEEDAAMGGADRAVAAQLKLIAETLRTSKPSFDGIMAGMVAMIAVKPDK